MDVIIWTNLITAAGTATVALGGLLVRSRQDRDSRDREAARLAAVDLIRAARALEQHYQRVVEVGMRGPNSSLADRVAVDARTASLAADLSQTAGAAELAFPDAYGFGVQRVNNIGQPGRCQR